MTSSLQKILSTRLERKIAANQPWGKAMNDHHLIAPSEDFRHKIVFGKGPTRRKAWRLTEDFLRENIGHMRRIAASTSLGYSRRIASLYIHSSAALTTDPQMPHDVSPVELVQHFFELTKTGDYTDASKRMDRSALLFWLASIRHKGADAELAYNLLADTHIDLVPRSRTKRRGKLQTCNGIPLADLDILSLTLRSMNTDKQTVGSYVVAWLEAGVACGARVFEWPRIRWLDRDKGLLEIRNSKRKESPAANIAMRDARAAGQEPRGVHDIVPTEGSEPAASEDDQFRTVPVNVEDVPKVDEHMRNLWECIKERIAAGLTEEDAFEAFYDRCRNALLAACKVAFPVKGRRRRKNYTLRSGRSQFAANRKLLCSIEQVAEWMGHHDVSVTAKEYPHPKYGWGAGEHVKYQNKPVPPMQRGRQRERERERER